MKNNSSKQFLLLFIILFIGLVFRFYKLGTTPSGLYVDEASLGYNSYSILKTGMDEFGKKFPVMFRSFTTFQSPVYSYLSIPFLALLDMNTFSIRLPSAIFGFLTIPLLYFLVLKLTSKKTAIISALLLAISPWHILYSRTAYETNIALFFLLLGTLFFYYSLKKPWLMLLSAICFSISMLSYRAEMLIVPILVLVLLVNYYKAIKTKLNTYLFPLIISLIVALVLLFPTLKIINTPGFNARTSTLNIFSDSNQKPWGYNDLFKTKRLKFWH